MALLAFFLYWYKCSFLFIWHNVHVIITINSQLFYTYRTWRYLLTDLLFTLLLLKKLYINYYFKIAIYTAIRTYYNLLNHYFILYVHLSSIWIKIMCWFNNDSQYLFLSLCWFNNDSRYLLLYPIHLTHGSDVGA